MITYRNVEGKSESSDAMKVEVVKGGKNEKPEKRYPRIDLPIEILPEAKKWGIGETYEIHLKVRMTGIRVREEDKNHMGMGMSYDNSADFEIRGIATDGKSDTKKIKKVPRY